MVQMEPNYNFTTAPSEWVPGYPACDKELPAGKSVRGSASLSAACKTTPRAVTTRQGQILMLQMLKRQRVQESKMRAKRKTDLNYLKFT